MSTDPQQHRDAGQREAVVLAVTSGKGGVGKTSVSVNLAVMLARRGHRTFVVDVDLGLANCHIVAGIKPRATLSDYLENRVTLIDTIVKGPGGVRFISGGSGVREMANLDTMGRRRILDAARDLRAYCDVLILDTAAGISRSVTDFVSISDHVIVVATPDFAAVADAYGMVKTLRQEHCQAPLHMIVNRVRSPEEAQQVYAKLNGCTDRFLGTGLNYLGLVPEHSIVELAVTERMPFCEGHPDSVAARYVEKVAMSLEKLLALDSTAGVSSVRGLPL